jgi:hypothetical protein
VNNAPTLKQQWLQQWMYMLAGMACSAATRFRLAALVVAARILLLPLCHAIWLVASCAVLAGTVGIAPNSSTSSREGVPLSELALLMALIYEVAIIFATFTSVRCNELLGGTVVNCLHPNILFLLPVLFIAGPMFMILRSR